MALVENGGNRPARKAPAKAPFAPCVDAGETPFPPGRSGDPCLRVHAFALVCAAAGNMRLTTGRPGGGHLLVKVDLMGKFGAPNDPWLKGPCPKTTGGKENSLSSSSLRISARAVTPRTSFSSSSSSSASALLGSSAQVRESRPGELLSLNSSQRIERADAYGRTCVHEN